jgi:hypothetical protein
MEISQFWDLSQGAADRALLGAYSISLDYHCNTRRTAYTVWMYLFTESKKKRK